VNKSQKKFIRAVKEACATGTRPASRVGYLPTITHGAITPPRSNSVAVVRGSRVNPDDYDE
jgi:hypothetical protein